MERNQCNPKWGHLGRCYNLLRNQCRRAISAGDSESSRRSHRNLCDRRSNPAKLCNYIALGVLSVSGAIPALAEQPKVQNNSSPVAAATGNVTNQAVQFQNTGAPSRQYFASNNSCNGTTLQFSPFYMGNDTIPYQSTGYVRSNNFGAQVSISVPLDGSMVELCKSIARRNEQKMRLDYELVRALRCSELQTNGFTFRPGSRMEVLCNDIVPIVSVND